MTITEIPIQLTLPPSEIPRSPGQHVSAIIRCLATEMGILKPEWAEELSLVDVREITDPVAVLRMLIGLAWERYYIQEILAPKLGVVHQPGELECDGVYGSPDGESLSVMLTLKGKEQWQSVIHEIKSTYKSTRTVGDLTNETMWLMQIKSYCKMKGTCHAMLHVLFVCGDYSYPIKPILKMWQLEFTQEEIDSNWKMLMEYLEYRREKDDLSQQTA
jgi:hypothetical protein